MADFISNAASTFPHNIKIHIKQSTKLDLKYIYNYVKDYPTLSNIKINYDKSKWNIKVIKSIKTPWDIQNFETSIRAFLNDFCVFNKEF